MKNWAVLILGALVLWIGAYCLTLLLDGGAPQQSEVLEIAGIAETSQSQVISEPRMAATRAEEPAAPTEDELFLARLEAQIGPLPPYKAGLNPKALAYYWATENMAPQAATREQAIIEGVPASQLADIMNCFHEAIRSGQLPKDYLIEPLNEKAYVRDPVGQELIDRNIKFGGANDAIEARAFFCKVLKDNALGTGRRSRDQVVDYYSSSRIWNPELRAINELTADHLFEVEMRHFERISDFIDDSELVDEFLLLQELKLTQGDYIALPFNAVSVLGGCTQKATKTRPLHSSLLAVGGWTISVQIKPGASPRFDLLQQRLEAYLDDRTAELKSVLASL